ncbi:predicted protein [Postia placenta Mad-698-R]|nr:predicted protein [Postia placenta Mad-698-R]
MSSPTAIPDKETLKLLLPLRYDGKSVVECNRFISQLLIYWTINTALSSLELKIQVALSLLDGDARAWATPIFSQLASVQMGIQGATTPFVDEKAFLQAFKARFGNLDDAAAAQVELAKLCSDKTMREKRTAAEFSALFKGPVDRSGYGNLELRDKYLSGIPSRVYRKLKLETFATFFSARGRGRGGARGGAPSSHAASASINMAVGKGNFPGTCFGCGKQGYRRFECPNCGSWVRAEGSNPQIVAHQQLVSYYQRHPPAHPEDVFATLRINVEPAQTTENLQSPVNEQPFEFPDVQYIPIEAPELPPAPPTPTNAPVEVPMATFTQADIDQRIAVALAAYQSQQSTANRPLRLDIPAPEPFSGKAEDLRRFIQCVLSYFVATNNTRLSDEAKIAFTVALMRKDLGKTWADAYYEKSAGGVQVYPDWAAFATALEEAFPEHGTRIKAHQILMKLPERQKNKKTALSLGNYVTRFEQLASKAQLKDAEVNGVNRTENDYHTLHANFVKELPKELYVSLATRVARDRPSTMKAWYDEVRNADAAEQGALTVTDTRDYGEPMDIDAAAVAATFASTSGGRKWELGAVLNEADRKLHRDGNLCFYCHIKGHSAKDCRKKAAA